jgi:hypothetical protein
MKTKQSKRKAVKAVHERNKQARPDVDLAADLSHPLVRLFNWIDPEHTKLAIWVGGKNSNARGKPTFMKMVASGLPNNPPRWPEVSAMVEFRWTLISGVAAIFATISVTPVSCAAA